MTEEAEKNRKSGDISISSRQNETVYQLETIETLLDLSFGKMKKESEILKEFMSLTGAEEEASKELLASCHWNIEEAEAKFKQTCSALNDKRKNENQGASVVLKGSAVQTTSSQNEPKVARRGAGKFSRGFSMVDPEMVSKLHKDIKTKGDEDTDENYGYFQDVTHYSFTLPDFSLYDNEFVEFLMKELIENSTLRSLEESGHLNWWTRNDRFRRLLPLSTSGDGNCLLHAASLGIWGVHDRLLNLRQAVHRTLSSSLAERTIKRRWRWYEWVKNVGGAEMVWEPTEKEWETEWQSVLALAIAKPRDSATKQPLTTVLEVSDVTTTDNAERNVEEAMTRPRQFSFSSEPRYESLEEIHIFSLAHVLRRPIVVIADTMLYDFEGNALCPIPFAGVYLPVECDPAECCRIPLVLAFFSGHFSPLVAMETQRNRLTKSAVGSDGVSKVVVPLVDKSFETLPLPFAVDPGEDWDWSKKDSSAVKVHSLTSEARMSLLKKYMDVFSITIKVPASNESKPAGQSALVPTAFAANIGEDNEVQSDTFVEHSVAVAELPRGNQPSYYQEIITGYIEKAKERFKFEQEIKVSQVTKNTCTTPTMQCANDGCDLYGTVANNYLCTKCFQLQTKTIKELEVRGGGRPVPSCDPPSYADAVKDNVRYPPSSTRDSQPRRTTLSQNNPTKCQATGCTFYGTIDRGGFCSKCYQENN